MELNHTEMPEDIQDSPCSVSDEQELFCVILVLKSQSHFESQVSKNYQGDNMKNPLFLPLNINKTPGTFRASKLIEFRYS